MQIVAKLYICSACDVNVRGNNMFVGLRSYSCICIFIFIFILSKTVPFGTLDINSL